MNGLPLVPVRPVYNRPPRGKTTARGYGHAHQVARERVLRKRPLCEVCGNDFATDLHHRDGNPHNRAPANLVAACEGCHHGVLHGGT